MRAKRCRWKGATGVGRSTGRHGCAQWRRRGRCSLPKRWPTWPEPCRGWPTWSGDGCRSGGWPSRCGCCSCSRSRSSRSWRPPLMAPPSRGCWPLCVRTPQAGQAWPVKGVLEIAQLYRRPVVTAWVAGDGPEEAEPDGTWPESVDMIDLRGERYAAALPRFVAHLTQVAGRQENVDTIDLRGEHYAEVAPRNPYKGLRAFQEEDAGDFFGRKRLVAELLAAVRTYTQPGATRFLAVVGPSGSGKSSVVLAGLLPQLRGGAVPGSARWVYLAPLVPAAHPLEALSIALNNALPQSSLTAIRADLEGSKRGLHLLAGRLVSHPEARVVLVVDQAEEIFTL